MQQATLEFISTDILHKLVNMKPFTLMIQRKGPEYDSPTTQRIIQSEHLPHLFGLRDDGFVLISMPVMDHSDITAIAVYSSIDKEVVKRITDEDPAVKKGIFVYELLNCLGMKGDQLV